MSRNRGLPLSGLLSPSCSGRIASEEALMGFGVMGVKPGGQAFGRVGIYNFENGIPTFKFAVNFNMEDGSPIYRPEAVGRQSVSDSEMALVHWVQGSLFNTDIKPGKYVLKIDNLDQPADIPINEWAKQIERELPRRREFAMERRLEAAFEMFETHLALDHPYEDGVLPEAPKMVPMIILDQIEPAYVQDCITPTIPVVEVAVTPDEFRSLALNRLSEGLRVPTGHYREIKATFIRSFENLDSMMGVARNAMFAMTLERATESVRDTAEKHLASLDPKRVKLDVQRQHINMALGALKAYVEWRNPDGTVRMFVPPQPIPTNQQPTLEYKRALAQFEHPMFYALHSPAVQVVEKFMNDGTFPYNGLELFRPLR